MTAVVAAFSKIPGYQERFRKVFGTGVTKEGFAKAIAAFERTVFSGDSPYDRFTQGDGSALDDAQKHGRELFRRNCSGCHTPPLFSNYRFFNAGVGMDKPNPDEGRKKISGKDRDLGKFRVPALRNVADLYPYFHDGSVASLEDAVALMAGGGKENAESLRDVQVGAREQSHGEGPQGFRRVPQGALRQVSGHRAAGIAEVSGRRPRLTTGRSTRFSPS